MRWLYHVWLIKRWSVAVQQKWVKQFHGFCNLRGCRVAGIILSGQLVCLRAGTAHAHKDDEDKLVHGFGF